MPGLNPLLTMIVYNLHLQSKFNANRQVKMEQISGYAFFCISNGVIPFKCLCINMGDPAAKGIAGQR